MLVSGKTADSTGFSLPLKNGRNAGIGVGSSGFVLDLVQDIRGVNDQAPFRDLPLSRQGTAGDFCY